jgi:hypothetical protein
MSHYEGTPHDMLRRPRPGSFVSTGYSDFRDACLWQEVDLGTDHASQLYSATLDGFPSFTKFRKGIVVRKMASLDPPPNDGANYFVEKTCAHDENDDSTFYATHNWMYDDENGQPQRYAELVCRDPDDWDWVEWDWAAMEPV